MILSSLLYSWIVYDETWRMLCFLHHCCCPLRWSKALPLRLADASRSEASILGVLFHRRKKTLPRCPDAHADAQCFDDKGWWIEIDRLDGWLGFLCSCYWTWTQRFLFQLLSSFCFPTPGRVGERSSVAWLGFLVRPFKRPRVGLRVHST